MCSECMPISVARMVLIISFRSALFWSTTTQYRRKIILVVSFAAHGPEIEGDCAAASGCKWFVQTPSTLFLACASRPVLEWQRATCLERDLRGGEVGLLIVLFLLGRLEDLVTARMD